jgi:trans-2,3-dihydro-3-hydroxyanthranilate isomerase
VLTESRRYVVADVFTSTPLKGNAVAVFMDGSGLDGALMQHAARELNLSETVFVLPATAAGADARLRIFTPALELPFAGHPILGTGAVLSEDLGKEAVHLETGLGVIEVRLRRDAAASDSREAEMDQPVPEAEPFTGEAELLAALGVERSLLPIEAYLNGPRHVYVALADEQAVRALKPDFPALAGLGPLGVNCFARADAAGDFKMRMFGPELGVNEDPATGSAAGPLAIHLLRHGWIESGREIEIRQGEEIGRPSVLRARVEGSGRRPERVTVGGGVVLVARGEYWLE